MNIGDIINWNYGNGNEGLYSLRDVNDGTLLPHSTEKEYYDNRILIESKIDKDFFGNIKKITNTLLILHTQIGKVKLFVDHKQVQFIKPNLILAQRKII